MFKLAPSGNGQWAFSTLYAFLAGDDGAEPNWVVADAASNLYGSTEKGGNIQGGQCGDQGCGTVFELSPSQGGGWSKSTIYTFNFGLDGGYPSGGVTRDTSGNLYGETLFGGSFACPGEGCGVIYELTPQSGGSWTFSVPHTFNGLNGSLGRNPSGGLTLDSVGNLYGSTESGGDLSCSEGEGYGCGSIFELSPAAGGKFTFRLIGSFNVANGSYPLGGVTVDASGNLYGTASDGGDLNCNPPYGCGVVFEFTP